MAVDVGSAVGYLDLDISKFTSALTQANTEAARQAKTISGSFESGFSAVGGTLTSAGRTMTTAVTLPIVGLGTAVIKTSADFESSMSKVQAISGVTGEDFQMLSDKAREMGAKTRFSASESAEAFQYMAMAGWKTEQMMGGISGVMNLAAASGEELGTVSDIVTDAMTAFGLSAAGTSMVLKDGMQVEVDNTTRFVDALAAASNSSNTNVSMLGESFKYVAPVAGAMGYSVEDVAVALGLMANQGIKASQAGTSLRTLITNMAKPTDSMAAAMDTLDVSLENSDGSVKSLMEVMKDLRKGFGGGQIDANEFAASMNELQTAFDSGEMSEEEYQMAVEDLAVAMYGAEGAQKAQLAATLAGKTGMAGLLAIVNTTEEDFDNLTESIYNASGTSQEMADIMNNNLSGQITILKSQLQELALQFGEILLPAIRKIVEWLQNLILKLQEMTPEQREQIVRWAAIAAAIGPVLLAFGKLLTGIAGAIKTFQTLKTGFTAIQSGFSLMSSSAAAAGTSIGAVAAPILAVVAVIAVLIAAFKHLWDTNEGFRNKMTEIWEGIKTKFEETGKRITEVLNSLGFDFENFTEVVKSIWDGFCQVLAPIFEGAFEIISNSIGGVLDVIVGIFEVIVGVIQGFKDGDWTMLWQGLIDIVMAFVNGIGNLFNILGQTLWNLVQTIANLFGANWTMTWDQAKQAVVDWFNGVIQWFSQLPSRIATFFSNIWTNVITWASNMVSKAQELGTNFVQNIVNFFTQLPERIAYFIGFALGSVIKWAIEMPGKAREMATNFLTAVTDFFTQLPGRVLQFITSAYNNVITWAANMWNKAKEAGQNFLNSIVSFFTQLPGKVLQFLNSTINNVTNFVSNMRTKATAAAQGFFNNIVSGLSGLPSKMTEIGSNIVSGIWNGIQSGWQWLKDSVANLAQSLLQGAKDALGIKSPSRAFRDEFGYWIPLGAANGVDDGMPKATRQIQSAFDQMLNNLDVGMDSGNLVNGFISVLSQAWNSVAVWFETIESRIMNSVDNMREQLMMLIDTGKMIVNPDGTLEYVGYNGFGRSDNQSTLVEHNNDRPDGAGGNTFIFNSPKAIDEIEAARQLRKTQRDLSEGF